MYLHEEYISHAYLCSFKVCINLLVLKNFNRTCITSLNLENRYLKSISVLEAGYYPAVLH